MKYIIIMVFGIVLFFIGLFLNTFSLVPIEIVIIFCVIGLVMFSFGGLSTSIIAVQKCIKLNHEEEPINN